ncbi:YtzH-like family protein [Virgibacillus kimchii]
MGLTVNDQLTLLVDLLDEHAGESTATPSEYQQIARLVQSMIDNGTIHDDHLLQLLPQIQQYGLEGESTANVANHITNNKQNIDSWINAIDQHTLK